MASRGEEKERRRAERLAAERRAASEARRRLILGYAAAAILAGAVVVGIVVALIGSGEGSAGGDFPDNAHINLSTGSDLGVEPDGREGTEPPPIEQANLEKAAAAANCELRVNLPNEGATHVEDESVDYETEPPTSGNHNPIFQADGAYLETPDPVNFVHSLEHGRIEYQYSPDLSAKDQLELKGLFDESFGGVLLFPNEDMPYEVAATAWTHLIGCERYEGGATIDALRAFRDTYRGRGPEAVSFTP